MSNNKEIAQVRERASIGVAKNTTGFEIQPQNLQECIAFAEVMANTSIALPDHLKNDAGACLSVAMQAFQWQMNPFSVAAKSYKVKGAIAFEAQLIAAVVNTRSGIDKRLKYDFEGEGNDLVCIVTGYVDGEELVYKSPPKGSITTQNSPLWKSDPQQQLGYYSARAWARRHVPEVLLGVYDREERDQMDYEGPNKAKDVSPNAQKYMNSPKDESNTSGFDGGLIDEQINDIQNTGETTPQESLEGDIIKPEVNEAETSQTSAESQIEGNTVASNQEANDETEVEVLNNAEKDDLKNLLNDMLKQSDREAMEASAKRWRETTFKDCREVVYTAVKGILKSCLAVLKDEQDIEAVKEFYAEMLN